MCGVRLEGWRGRKMWGEEKGLWGCVRGSLLEEGWWRGNAGEKNDGVAMRGGEERGCLGMGKKMRSGGEECW